MIQAFVISRLDYCNELCITDELTRYSSERCRQARDRHQAMRSIISRQCSTSCTGFLCCSASCSRLRLSSTGPCPATPRVTSPTPMSDACVLPTLEHFLSVERAAVFETVPLPPQATSLEQSAAQSQTMWAVIRPVQAVTGDIFIRTVRPRRSVNCSRPNCAK